jgi:hypothetical protein
MTILVIRLTQCECGCTSFLLSLSPKTQWTEGSIELATFRCVRSITASRDLQPRSKNSRCKTYGLDSNNTLDLFQTRKLI